MKSIKRFIFKRTLAEMVEMSTATFTRFLQSRRLELQAMNVNPMSKKLPPKAVHYILRELGYE